MALKLFVIDRVIEDDACTGDQYGPFDEATVKANREQLSKERAAKKQAKEDGE